jgi:quercetin dioxygenase-like cupin family protein
LRQEFAIHVMLYKIRGCAKISSLRLAEAFTERAMPEDIRVGPLELRFLRSKHDTAGALDMFEMKVPPNARVPAPHYHRDWDETIYGLAGITTFVIDGQTLSIGSGDSVFIPRGTVHGFENRGAAVTRCLCVLTPGVLGPEYFRELGAELAASSPPDLVKMRAIMERHGLIPVAPA